MVFPESMKTWDIRGSFSMLFTRLPIGWVETAADVPIFQLKGRIGLPYALSFEGNIESVYFSTQIRTGLRWTYPIGRFSTRLGADIAYMFGRMHVSDFNNKAKGLLYYPHVALGYQTKELAFTLVGELNFVDILKITSGNTEISRAEKFHAGYSVGLFLEQKLWDNKVMIIGMNGYFQRFFYPAWPAFSASSRFYFIPQLNVGLVL